MWGKSGDRDWEAHPRGLEDLSVHHAAKKDASVSLNVCGVNRMVYQSLEMEMHKAASIVWMVWQYVRSKVAYSYAPKC